jgi:hypothetical protein
MGAAGKHAEHPGGICGIIWFREDVPVEGDRSVGTEDNSRLDWSVGRNFRKNALCFFASETDHVGDRVFVRTRVFVNVRGAYFEREACLFKEFSAAGRSGSQDQWAHGDIPSLTRFCEVELRQPAPVYDQRQ